MLLLGLLACGPAGAEEVAAIMVVSGDAMVRRDGALIPATAGLALQSTDTLVTDEDDAIIVHLSNDHVVRIDSELDLPVSGIVMLNAPKSAVEPGDQLASLLYSDERSGIDSALFDRAERVAGWHSRLTAAEAYTGITSDKAVESADALAPPPPPPGRGFSTEPRRESATQAIDEARDGEEEEEVVPIESVGNGGLGLEGAPTPEAADSPAAPAPRPRPSPASPRRVRKDPTSPAAGERPKKGSGGGKEKTLAEDRSQPIAGAEAPVGSVSPEALAARFADGGALRQCIVDWAADLPVPVASVDITVIVEPDGRIERLAAGGGLFLPECARTAGEETVLDASASSPVRFTVELD